MLHRAWRGHEGSRDALVHVDDLAADSATLRRAVEQLDGDVVLVAHSGGGTVLARRQPTTRRCSTASTEPRAVTRALVPAAAAGMPLVVGAAAAQLARALHRPSDIVGGWLWATAWTTGVSTGCVRFGTAQC